MVRLAATLATKKCGKDKGKISTLFLNLNTNIKKKTNKLFSTEKGK
jgi:hypothetical protein